MGNTIVKYPALSPYRKQNGFILTEDENPNTFVKKLVKNGLANPEDFDNALEITLEEGHVITILPFSKNNHIDYGKIYIWRSVYNRPLVSDCTV